MYINLVLLIMLFRGILPLQKYATRCVSTGGTSIFLYTYSFAYPFLQSLTYLYTYLGVLGRVYNPNKLKMASEKGDSKVSESIVKSAGSNSNALNGDVSHT